MQLFMVEKVRREARRIMSMSFPLSMSYTEESPVVALSSITTIPNETPPRE